MRKWPVLSHCVSEFNTECCKFTLATWYYDCVFHIFSSEYATSLMIASELTNERWDWLGLYQVLQGCQYSSQRSVSKVAFKPKMWTNSHENRTMLRSRNGVMIRFKIISLLPQNRTHLLFAIKVNLKNTFCVQFSSRCSIHWWTMHQYLLSWFDWLVKNNSLKRNATN